MRTSKNLMKLPILETPRCPICGAPMINLGGEYYCLVCDPIEEYYG